MQILSISFACLSYVVYLHVLGGEQSSQLQCPPISRNSNVCTTPSLLARKTSSESEYSNDASGSPSVPDINSNIIVAVDL